MKHVVSPPPVSGRLALELVSLAASLTHQDPHLLLPEEPGEQRRDRQAHYTKMSRFSGGGGQPLVREQLLVRTEEQTGNWRR